MIVYIKPHSSIPFEFEHMKPIPIEFDSVDDRISFDTFKCTGRYDSDGIQSIWVTAFMVGKWNSADISFTDDMRIITRGRFCLKAINSELCTLMGTIKFYDMANTVEVEKLTREHESFKNTPYPPKSLSQALKIAINSVYGLNSMVDKGTRNLHEISELAVEKIISNGPATIVFWNDGTKTVVKCDIYDEDDLYDAVANAIAKKVFGSTSKFHRIVDKKCRTSEKKNGDHQLRRRKA